MLEASRRRNAAKVILGHVQVTELIVSLPFHISCECACNVLKMVGLGVVLNYVVSDRRRQTGLETATWAFLLLSLKAREVCDYWITETGKCILRVAAWKYGKVTLQRLR